MYLSVLVCLSVSVSVCMSVMVCLSVSVSALTRLSVSPRQFLSVPLPRLQYGCLACLPQWGHVRQEDQTEAVGPSVQDQAQGHHRAPAYPQHQALGQDQD